MRESKMTKKQEKYNDYEKETLVLGKGTKFEGTYTKSSYIKGKYKQLRDFGYTTLTEDEVERQLEKVIVGEETSIIGNFIETDYTDGLDYRYS